MFRRILRPHITLLLAICGAKLMHDEMTLPLSDLYTKQNQAVQTNFAVRAFRISCKNIARILPEYCLDILFRIRIELQNREG